MLNSLRWFSCALAICVTALPVHAQVNWEIQRTFHIGGEGGWDYVTVDEPGHRLFVTRTTHTMIIDATSGKTLGDIPGQTKAHGVALVPRLNRGFITDGGGSIVLFDMTTYAVLGKLASLPDSDGIIYDPKLDLVLAVSGDGDALMTIRPDVDAKTGKIDTPIALGGAPEFLVSDGNGKVYINLEDKNQVAVVDLPSRKKETKWPVAPGGSPVGMAIDNAGHRLFIGCRKPQKLIAMNTQNGKVEASLPIGAGVDATAFYGGEAFASCVDGSLIVASAKAGKLDLAGSVKTPAGARTMAFNHTTQQIYLPTAEMEPSAGGRPRAKPNTFMIVVVGPHSGTPHSGTR